MTVFVIISSNIASAQLIQVEQTVYGMDCAPCAYAVEGEMMNKSGVKKAQVDLDKGEIQDGVKKSGFSAKEAKVVLKGNLLKDDGTWKVKVNEETFQVTTHTKKKILSKLKEGKVKLEGVVPDEEDKQPDHHWKITVKNIINTN
ncbi:MAG: hypothetical protein BRD50_08810 [Bacteroidetes bacterium SW_11_45_7]|nr:MAG: hypothetical protein BRD50_08810 [Bacteroidetes bacterium SW_11_45_7]